ncbi:type IV pilus biogenesis protein PilP [Methylobacterium brachiatum]
MRTLAVLAAVFLSSASAFAQTQQIQLPPVGGAPAAPLGLPQAPDAGASGQAAGLTGGLPGAGAPQHGPYGQPGIVPVAVTSPQPTVAPPQPPQFGVNPQGAPSPLPTGPGVQPGPAGLGVGEAPAGQIQQKLEALRVRAEERLGQLDNAAPIVSGSQLQQMQQRQLRIRDTLMMLQEAKALGDIMKQLDDMGGPGAKAGPAPSEEETKHKIDEAVQQALAQRKLEEENAPKPLVASVHGSGGSLRAVVLVPYVGQFTVRQGSSLPGGMKVVSISDAGVTVSKDGRRIPLAFGTEVPRIQPVSAVGGAPGPMGRTVQMPIGASPLPMGGLGSR